MSASIRNYNGFYLATFRDASGNYRGYATRTSKREILDACKERGVNNPAWEN